MPRIAQIIRSSATWYQPIVDEKDMSEHLVDEKWQADNFKKRDFWLGRNRDGIDIGTVSLQYFGDSAYLGYVYLDTAHTGKGHGKRLLEHARKIAREKGMERMVLLAHPKAEWAIKAYEKFGFKKLAGDKKSVLSWNDGALKTYYEEGFHLFHYEL